LIEVPIRDLAEMTGKNSGGPTAKSDMVHTTVEDDDLVLLQEHAILREAGFDEEQIAC
jgi:hypothetical protein